MITYLKGDATNPNICGNKFIVHICNDQGGWGKGFVLAISKKWKEPEEAYRKWYKKNWNDHEQAPFELGQIQKIKVDPEIHVINMIAQEGYSKTYNVTKRYVSYMDLESCLNKVAKLAKIYSASVHMPRIGCGLGGSTWDEIEPIINRTLVDTPVFVYDFEV